MKKIIMICFSFLVFMTVLSAADSKVLDYKFHESVEVLTEKSTLYGQFVYFGDWPQTIKAEDVIIDENQSEEHGAFTYYKGSDGYWYCKIVEKSYKWAENQVYSDKSEVKKQDANSTRYFKVEPIKWCILTRNYNNTNQALLLCQFIIDAPKFPNAEYYRLIDDKLIYSNNYKESEMRAYLNGLSYNDTKDFYKLWVWKFPDYSDFLNYVNGLPDEEKPLHYSNNQYLNKGFLQTAFSEKAQKKIAVTEVDNSYVSNIHYPVERIAPWNTGRDDYACENTYDKVFLLSEYEVTQSDFSFGTLSDYGIRNVRIFSATDFAKARGIYDYGNQHYTFWWLRTPMNGDLRLVRYVEYQGASADALGGQGGIVPALCISLE